MSTSLHVRRHDVSCRVSGSPVVSIETVRSALGEGFVERLGAALAGADHGSAYWVIRRLDLRVAVEAGWSPGQVAGAVADSFVRGLDTLLEAGTTSDTVLWFPSRAAFLAGFLLDQAAGRVAARWEYEHVTALAPGSGSGLLRLAQADPQAVLEALLELDDVETGRVVAAVDAADTAGVLSTIAGQGTSRPALVLDATRELCRLGRLGKGSALLVALKAARQYGAGQLASIIGPALAVGDLVALMGRELSSVVGRTGEDATAKTGLELAGTEAAVGERVTRSSWDNVLHAIGAGRWGEVHALLGGGRTDAVLPLVQWTAAERAELCCILADPFDEAARMSTELRTPFGGMFLLLPLLDELWDWKAATRSWPSIGEASPDRLARLLVIAAALGRDTTATCVGDRVLRLALDIAEGFDSMALVSWLDCLSPTQLRAFEGVAGGRLAAEPNELLALPAPYRGIGAELLSRAASSVVCELARRLPGMSGSTAPYLQANVLDIEARITIEPAAAVVKLGAPPLSVLLSMAGLNRGSFRLEGCGERRWTLTMRS